MRYSLLDELTRAASVLGSWCTFPGAVPRKEIMTTFKEKSKRDKVKDKETTSEGAQNMNT